MIGQKFTRWTVVSYSHKKGPHHYWNCLCDCGNTGIIQQGSLGKRSFSCGCLRKEIARDVNTTHGQSKTLLHDVWSRMKQRCENPATDHFDRYGGRGIKVCDRWQSFENFYADMGDKWEKGLTIDRIDNEGNYEPSNCRWATCREQAANRRSSIIIDTPWGAMTCTEASRMIGINKSSFFQRMKEWDRSRWFVAGKSDKRHRQLPALSLSDQWSGAN